METIVVIENENNKPLHTACNNRAASNTAKLFAKQPNNVPTVKNDNALITNCRLEKRFVNAGC